MEEKIIIQSKNKNAGLIRNIIWILGLVIGAILMFVDASSMKDYYEGAFLGEKAQELREMGLLEYMFGPEKGADFLYFLIPVALMFIIGLVVYFATHKVELTISNKRVYGVAAFGKRVDLPLDSISSVGTSLLSSITVATSSGKICFMGVKDRDDIHKALSNLLIERQSKPVVASTIKQEIPQSNAEELKKYKELLDMGVITQEEFDAKKKQLLGL